MSKTEESTTPSKDELHLTLLISKRERLFSRLQISYDLIKDLPDKEGIFLARCQKLETDFNAFEEIQDDILKLNLIVPKASRVDTDAVTRSYEELYFVISAQYSNLIAHKASSNNLVQSPMRPIQPKLPRIDLAKFKGDIEKFPSFISLFDTLVHNTDLAPIQKFAFLKSHLEGPALSVIEAFSFTNENYDAAYTKLVERFTEKRLVANHYLNKLLQFKPLNSDSPTNLRQFLDVFCVQYSSLQALKVPDLLDFVFVTLAFKVLDSNTKRLFEQQHTEVIFPTFKELEIFVQDQYKIASVMQSSSVLKVNSAAPLTSKPTYRNSSTKSFVATGGKPSSFSLVTPSAENTKPILTPSMKIECPFCKSCHKLSACSQFIALTPEKRREFVKQSNRCFSCLGTHRIANCASKFSCRECNKRSHNTLLHYNHSNNSSEYSSSSVITRTIETPSPVVVANTLNCRLNSKFSALLGTAKCRILSSSGSWIEIRIVIDPGSESSFITESLAHTLALPRQKCSTNILGIGSTSLPSNNGLVSCTIAPSTSLKPKLFVDCIVLPRIISALPKQVLEPQIHKRFFNINLADPEFDHPRRVDLLLGVQHYCDILSDKPTVLRGSPSAISTIFGYVLFGKLPNSTDASFDSSNSLITQSAPIDELLKRFWESEEVSINIPENPSDVFCEQYFSKTVTRDDFGRYGVSLPFRDGSPPTNLGSTREIAHQRLLRLEHRLTKNLDLKEKYLRNLQDYVEQDHMRLTSTPCEYLFTHHAVVKDSTSTQVRVVFNASEKSNISLSLNDFLLTGPKLQSDIPLILLNFRLYPVALTADIKQMFRCIRLNPDDRKFTHILWRSDFSCPIQEWEFVTLPFGLACSPYLAQRAIQQLVLDEGHSYSLASNSLSTDMYVDDIVSGASSVEEAIHLYSQLTMLLSKAGFELRKFSSNSSEVISHIPLSHQETPLTFGSESSIKLLGLQWNPKSDTFSYRLNFENPVFTKRGVLSQVARIFDINGYLSPIVFWIKHLIQQLWLSGHGWDDPLEPELHNKWHKFHSELSLITNISIPRYVLVNDPLRKSTTFLGFADASTLGYAACLYIRVELCNNNTQIFLIKSKSKVAPLKTLSVPRLELSAAYLLVNLIKSLDSFLNKFPDSKLFCFTDSSTVLSWLRTSPHRLKTFVANRVVPIIEIVPPQSWFHISSEENPADPASRGLYPSQLVVCNLWWQAPTYFLQPIDSWPLVKPELEIHLPELKESSVTMISTTDPNPLLLIFDKFSSFRRLQRSFSYILRFIKNVRAPIGQRELGPLTSNDLKQASFLIVRITQEHYFADTYSALQNKKCCPPSLRPLTPFISSDGLLRVGGRISHAPLADEAKHPLLIPRKTHLAKLLCDQYHRDTFHGGPQLVQSILQRQYWIPGVRGLLRQRIFLCLDCYRFKAKPLTPLMSDIPSFRFTQCRAFVNTGIDLAGPFSLKESKRRNARSTKCWLALFICMSTRAVYLDVVSEISSAAFLAALDRFVSRRGVPKKLFSDRGTNFIGAARELRQIYQVLAQEPSLSNYCAERKIDWSFNPPLAPNFGGLWESAIKSAKHHLKRIVGDRALTFEEFSTLLARVEAILNSRPLCPLTSSPSDGFDYLTPGHFLVGAPLVLSRPELDYSEISPNLCSRWQLLSRTLQDFWRRWSHEYIHTLIKRTKWDKSLPNLGIGDIVLLMDNTQPPTSWKVGFIEQTYPGSDGVVRVVKLRTSSGPLTRPVNKLAPLPKSDWLRPSDDDNS